MSTILPAHRLPRRRRFAAASGAVALFLASVVAVSWPGPASAGSGSGGGTPQVEIVKTAVQDGSELDVSTPLLPGDTFDYVLTVTNSGDTRVRNVTVTDDLPSTVEPAGDVTVADGDTVVDTVPGADPVEVTIDSMLRGEVRTITIPVRVVGDAKGCSTFDNSASVTYVHGYGEEYVAESNVVTLSVGCADLTIEKVADVDGPVVVGDEVTYDISVALADVSHPVAVKPVVITDEIDESLFAFVSATDGGTFADGVVTWTLADGLTPGDPPTTVSLTLRILAPDQVASPDYTNIACVGLTPDDETPIVKPGDDCDEATVSTGSVDLSLAKLVNGVSSTEVAVGATVTYSLTVTNEGPDGATGVVVEDALPAAVTFIQQTGGDGELSDDGATWTVGAVDAGASATVTFTATVDEAGTHTNVAEITEVDQPDTDSTPGNGCEGAHADEDDCAEATVIATEESGSLSLVKTNTPTGTLDGYLDAAGAPRTITYGLTVTAGDLAETDVVVTDTVPAGTALVANSLTCDGPGTCVTGVAGSDLSWGVGTLAAGASRTVHFVVTVLPPTTSQAAAGSWTITNVGLATSSTHQTPSNEVENVVVVSNSALSIVKSNSPDEDAQLKFGDVVTYTLAVTVDASSTSPQTGVVVTDTIPGYDPNYPDSGVATYKGGATCLEPIPAGGTCLVTDIVDGGVTTGLIWALGTMSPGETRQVTFSVTLEEQDPVEGSETIDFQNAAAVESDSQPSTPSNVVVNTVTLVDVSDNTEDLPPTGAQYPLARLGVFGLLLVALGAVLIRQPTLLPARQPRGRHAAR